MTWNIIYHGLDFRWVIITINLMRYIYFMQKIFCNHILKETLKKGLEKKLPGKILKFLRNKSHLGFRFSNNAIFNSTILSKLNSKTNFLLQFFLHFQNSCEIICETKKLLWKTSLRIYWKTLLLFKRNLIFVPPIIASPGSHKDQPNITFLTCQNETLGV